MKLGVLTTSYPRAPGDPAGSFVAAQVGALRALGHDVEVIAAGGPARDEATHADDVVRVRDRSARLFYQGGAPDRLEHAPARALAAAAAFSVRMTAAVLARAHRWDQVIAHWLVPSALAALPTRAPLVAIAHGGDVHTLRRLRLLAPALHALRARKARLVFVSEALRTIARAAAPRLGGWLDAAAIQPMGLDLDRFAAIERAPAQPPTILVVARLIALKGVDVAIDALGHLRTPARLVIAGDGPARRELERRARERPGVTFVGAVDADHRDRLLREASVVVVPSRTVGGGRTEGMPMIALEALAAGVPLVASAVGGLAELAAPARLVPPDAPAALADAIDEALGAPAAPAALRASVAHLDWRRVAARFLQ